MRSFLDTIKIIEKKMREPLPGFSSHDRYMYKGRIKPDYVIPDDVRRSAVLILLCPVEEEPYFPLILRPKYDGKHGGQMALPGGKEEPEDEDIIRTALREAQEEVGIKAIDVEVIGQLTQVFIPTSNYLVHPVVGYLDYKPEFFPSKEEVDEIFFAPLKEILTGNALETRTMNLMGQNIPIPGFNIQGQWVWGATSMMLGEFSDVINGDF